ncbi:pyridoxine/pyridoxal/pyridoxamine kinase [Brevibacillus sp. SYP-B805]|uniref:pyridoxine/pyridoxal/pyridoxamine kinase n=1 Tax=Brevibacillus sp. SYP-B805 TaxID=1578199 RepID=UPI0013ED99C2|nr:pyridoxine/pyridoxal/pyridoxamine kinase [Brevibacillus sp. SYP-B805]NGQ95867.1 pyridoxine/pyridoxal/pyridoxamine kinase [Brevibacillus sp. SYP-B805]
MSMQKALTIAGSDTSGGAGIQADLKTFQELGVYGMTALTVVVAQDPHNDWFHAVYPHGLNVVEAQLETVLAGIGVDAVKTGMLGSTELIELVGRKIDQYQLKNVVIDPVMVCKGADEVLHPESAVALRDVLVPRATVVTPNLFEAAVLSGMPPLTTVDAMKEAAARIHERGAQYVLVKGGGKLQHEKAIDVLYDGSTFDILEGERIPTTYTHGAGCTYSAAITAELAKGKSVRDAIRIAKAFITEAIRHSFPLNKYVGPTNHGAYRHSHVK